MNHGMNSYVRLAAKLLGGTSVAAIAMVGSGAWAQEASSISSDSLDTVIVTGTLIKGINPVGTNLITVDASKAIQSGLLTTDQVLAQIPQITNLFNTTGVVTNTNINFNGLRPAIRSTPSINIVGGSTTLVLVDGNNWVGVNPLGTTPDPGILPAGVLQRVDVAPDGNSSLYGANAITGVLNFITRTSYAGFQAGFSEGFADGYNAFDGNAMAGKEWSSGDVYLAFEHKSNTPLFNGSRDYLRQTYLSNRDTRSTTCPLPNITVSTNVNYAVNAFPANTPGSLKANSTGPFVALDPVTNTGGFNRCDTSYNSTLVSKEDANSVFLGFRQNLTQDVVFSTKVIWSSRLESQAANQLSYTGTIDTSNPYFQSLNGETQQTVNFSFAPYLGTSSYTNAPLIEVIQVTPQVTAPLPWGDWEAKVTGNYGRSFSSAFARLVNTTAANQAMRRVADPNSNTGFSPVLTASSTTGNAIDPYNVALTNPTLLNEILNFGQYGKAVQHQTQLQANFDGSLFDIWGGAVKAVIGGKYSMEDFISQWDINVPIGQQSGSPIPGGQFVFESTHRIATSAFAEVVAPIVSQDNAMPFVRELTLDVSGRYDHFSDFGESKTYKLGVTYKPFDELVLRANMGTSFDAPSLADSLAPDGRLQYTAQRTSANTTVPPGTSSADALRPSILVPGGDPNLGPETANTWSIGADYQPGDLGFVDLTGLSLSATRWHAFIAHQIGTPSSSLLFTVPSYSRFYIINPTLAQLRAFGYSSFVQGPGPDLSSIYNAAGTNDPGTRSPLSPYILTQARRTNLGNDTLDGYDFKVDYTKDTDFGTLSGGIAGTVSLQNKTQGGFGLPWSSIQATNVPLYQVSFNLGITSGAFSARATMNYSPSYQTSPTAQNRTLFNQTRIGAFSPVNINFSYDLTGLTSWSDNSSVSLAINNIADVHPPIVLTGGTANGSTIGRYIQVGLRKSF